MIALQIKFPRALVVVATFVALGAVTGCHKKASGVNPSTLGPAPAAPATAPTATITADPLAIDLGQSVVLNWRSENATSVTIDGIGDVNLNGPRPSRPPTPPTFTSPRRVTAERPKPTSVSPSVSPSHPPLPRQLLRTWEAKPPSIRT